MKYSRQRQMILEAVKSHLCHPTADTVYQLLYPENPSLSLGTVYRNLNCLAADGQIAKLKMPAGGDRFDGTIAPHYHMVCEVCGGVQDCPIEVMSGFEEVVRQQTGFTIHSHGIVISGECVACTKEHPSKNDGDNQS